MNILINALPNPLPDNAFVAVDLELFGAEKHRLHRPTGRFACLTLCPDGENVYLLANEEIVDLALGRIENCVWSFHNSQFDLQQLRRWSNVPPRKKLWDTMIIERLLYSGYYDRFALKDLSRRHLGRYLDKEARELFQDAQELTEETIHYAATDSITQWHVTQAQIPEVQKRPDVWKIWKEVDAPAVWAYLDFLGFRLDVDQWSELAEKNSTKAQELKDSFGFNPASPQQVKKSLIELGFTGLKSTGEDVLEQFIRKKPDNKASKVAQDVLDYRKIAKLASTYGMSMIDKHIEDENDYQVIHSNFKVTGASSGRNSSSDPNMQNIPFKREPLFRQPWIARPGHKLIVADWNAQEPRIHAYLTQDKNLIDIFKSDKDLYVETARRVYDKEITKDDPYRDIMKTMFLAVTYGQEPGDDETEKLQEKFWRGFPESEIWCSQQRRKKDYVESVMGRRMWVNKHNDAHERNNLNHPHQSTAADMMKLSISKIHQNWNFDCPYGAVAPIHDELILDVKEELAPEIAEFVSNTMVEVAENMCPGIPFVANAVICDNWLEGKQ